VARCAGLIAPLKYGATPPSPCFHSLSGWHIKSPVNYAGRAVGRLYRHVGLNLYDQPLSRGHISSAIAAVVAAPVPVSSPSPGLRSRNVCCRRRRNFSRRRRLCRGDPRDGPKAAGKRNAESIDRERERETEIAPDTDAKHEGNVMFDVIPGRNPGGARESVNRRVRTSAFRRGTKTTPVTSARLERGGNARGECGAARATPRGRRVRVHFRTSRSVRDHAVGNVTSRHAADIRRDSRDTLRRSFRNPAASRRCNAERLINAATRRRVPLSACIFLRAFAR